MLLKSGAREISGILVSRYFCIFNFFIFLSFFRSSPLNVKAALKNDAKLWREYLDHFLVLFIFLIISCLVRRMGMLLPSGLNKK